MIFPTIVYRCPGAHFGPDGSTFNSIGAADLEAYEAAIAAGWSATLPAAVKLWRNGPDEPAAKAEPADTAPPTRDEMLEQADKLKIQVDKRWSDATLLKKINEAMT